MARKAKEVKSSEIKDVVKAAPVEEVKAPARVETNAVATSAPVEAKEPVKAETKAEPKKPGRKPAAKKAAPAKKETAKSEVKAEPKKAGRKPAAKKAAAPAKDEKKAPAKAAKPVTTSVLQVAGNEFDFDKVVKAVEGLKKKNAGKSLEIYIKPEDYAIYYVVNGKGGKKIDL